jgi:O-antigen/teichoic acid export membrane protein
MGRDRFDLANLAQLGTILVRFSLVGIVVEGSDPLVRLAVFLAATSVGELLVARALAHRVDPSLRVALTRPRASELRILYGFGVPAFLITFSLRLISYTDTTVIGVVLGAASVGLYALPLQIIEFIRLAVTGYSRVLLARISVLHANGDEAAVRRAYLLSLRVASLIASFLLANVMWLGVPFLNLWVGPAFGEPARWVFVWLSLATFLHVFSTLAAQPFYSGMRKLRLPAQMLVLEAVLNLVLSITMAKRLGITGVALATLLPACISFAVLPGWLARTLSVSAGTWVRSAMLPAAMLGIAVSGAHWLMSFWIDPSSFALLALRTIGTLPGAILVALVTGNREERTDILARLRRIRRGAVFEEIRLPSDPA